MIHENNTALYNIAIVAYNMETETIDIYQTQESANLR